MADLGDRADDDLVDGSQDGRQGGPSGTDGGIGGVAASDERARQSVALLMAAARDDRHAVAILSMSLDVEQAREVAVFCAYVAARQFAADETRWSRPGLYDSVLQELALRLAAGEPGGSEG